MIGYGVSTVSDEKRFSFLVDVLGFSYTIRELWLGDICIALINRETPLSKIISINMQNWVEIDEA